VTATPAATLSRWRAFLRRRFSREETFGLYLTVGFLSCALLVALFGSLADEVFEVHGQGELDRRVTESVRSLQTPARDALALAVTELGSWRFLVPATLAVAGTLAWKKHRVSALLFAGCVVGGWLLEAVLKISYHRSRPDLWPALVTEKTPSFPSGHSTMSALFFGAAVAVVHHLSDRRAVRIAAAASAAALILAVGFTRIYLGAHWLTDVVAGFLVGLFWVVVCATGMEFFARRSRASPSR